jgi:hypothetical protein
MVAATTSSSVDSTALTAGDVPPEASSPSAATPRNAPVARRQSGKEIASSLLPWRLMWRLMGRTEEEGILRITELAARSRRLVVRKRWPPSTVTTAVWGPSTAMATTRWRPGRRNVQTHLVSGAGPVRLQCRTSRAAGCAPAAVKTIGPAASTARQLARRPPTARYGCRQSDTTLSTMPTRPARRGRPADFSKSDSRRRGDSATCTSSFTVSARAGLARQGRCLRAGLANGAPSFEPLSARCGDRCCRHRRWRCRRGLLPRVVSRRSSGFNSSNFASAGGLGVGGSWETFAATRGAALLAASRPADGLAVAARSCSEAPGALTCDAGAGVAARPATPSALGAESTRRRPEPPWRPARASPTA